jgi:hypothetical protein
MSLSSPHSGTVVVGLGRQSVNSSSSYLKGRHDFIYWSLSKLKQSYFAILSITVNFYAKSLA